MKGLTKLTVGSAGTAALGLAGFIVTTGPKTIAENLCEWSAGSICLVNQPQPLATGGTPSPTPLPLTVPTTPVAAPIPPVVPSETAAQPAAASPISVTLEPVLNAEDIRSNQFYVVGLMQLRLTNQGNAAAHVIWDNLASASEVQLEDGTTMEPRRGNKNQPKGVVSCRSAPEHCWENYRSAFTIIQPGQTVSAYTYYVQTVPSHKLQDMVAIKTLSYAARLFVAVPETGYRQAQPVDFVAVPVKNMVD